MTDGSEGMVKIGLLEGKGMQKQQGWHKKSVRNNDDFPFENIFY